MIKLSCNSCGAKLEITEDVNRFACMHCGSEWFVNKFGGTASLKPIEEGINIVAEKTDKVRKNTEILAAQVKIERLVERIQQLNNFLKTIDTNPQMINPNYELEKKKFEIAKEDARKKMDKEDTNNYFRKFFFVAASLLIFYIGINFFVDRDKFIFQLSRFEIHKLFSIIWNDSTGSGCSGLIILIGALPIVIFFAMCLSDFIIRTKAVDEYRLLSFTTPEYITDIAKQTENLELITIVEKEIANTNKSIAELKNFICSS